MNTFTAQELVSFYQQVADGGDVEVNLIHGGLSAEGWAQVNHGPNMESIVSYWRIKPAKKVIDLSVLIESGIDIEFSLDGEVWYVDGLNRILYEGYSGKEYAEWKYCRPRMNHIHAWQGGECPLPEGFRVKFWWRSGEEGDAGDAFYLGLRWSNEKRESDIIQFEVLGLADGYVMPWEQDHDI